MSKLDIKIQFLHQREHGLIIKKNLIFLRQNIAIYCENYREYIKALYGQKKDFFKIQLQLPQCS